jgi:hypothetical protein
MTEIREDRAPVADVPAGQGPKLVDVRESIRHRRRAQEAEQRAAALEAEVEELRQAQDGTNRSLEETLASERRRGEELQKRLDAMAAERELERELIRAGAIDPEAALLVARERLAALGDEEVDLPALAQRVLEEKPYLRPTQKREVEPLGRRSQGARPAGSSEAAKSRRLADSARQTGRRADLVEYMRTRRRGSKK